ncbi:MAG: glutathione S-transferase domain-containing protein [Actinomycetota bacterium]|nr:glutathione S-transferase domain-containing protein [Actinomycetota bacterium]
MAVKLHRCSLTWLKADVCTQVQRELDEAGIAYEVVQHPWRPRSRRTEAERLSGQRRLPFLEFDDGTILREDSKALRARIQAGNILPGGPAPGT